MIALLGKPGHRITVQTRTLREDDLGGKIYDWVDKYKDVVAWKQDADSRLIADYERRGLVVTHKIYTDTNLEIGEEDRIKFGDKYYTVVNIKAGAGLGILWRIDAKEVL